MDEVITDFEQLQAALSALPGVAPGHTRVYRGQNRGYPTLTPTGLRSAGAADMIWPIYASQLALGMAGTAGEGDDHGAGDDLTRAMLWTMAIKQHFGPGTAFLDVTRSVAVPTSICATSSSSAPSSRGRR